MALAIAQAAAFVLVAAAITAAVAWHFNAAYTRQIVESLRAEAAGLVELGEASGTSVLRQAIVERGRKGNGYLYVLADPSGRKLAGNLNRWPPELAEGANGGLFRYEGGSADGRDVAREAVGTAQRLGDGNMLLVARDLEQSRQAIDGARWWMLGGLAAIALFGIAIGAVGRRILLRRIEALSQETEDILDHDLSRRLPASGSGDEIDELAARLNGLLDRIQRLMQGMQDISDNIAHDLRTPLNRLRNRAEAALRDAAGGEAHHRRGLEQTIEAADEIIKTFNALLLIARLEAGAAEEEAAPFDVAMVARDVVEFYAPVAEDAGQTIVLSADRPATIRGSRHLVGQALANLVDNAIKYGAPSAGGEAGAVGVAVTPHADRVEVRVADRGPGIPPEARERVLERFVRLDASRSRPGTGLGLSLVAALARLHSGSVTLGDNRPGLAVTLTLANGAPSGAQP